MWSILDKGPDDLASLVAFIDRRGGFSCTSVVKSNVVDARTGQPSQLGGMQLGVERLEAIVA